jgi:hypothetical protein
MRYAAWLLFAVVGLAAAADPPRTFPHADWNAVLERFVDDRGLVDYEGLAEDRDALDRYLRTVERISPASHPELFASEDHALAYYINVYNAHVFDGVLERGPEKESVWTGGLISGYSFFVGRKIVVGGKKTNLKRLEDDVVRAEFDDPRIHAALNCASIGCPRLPHEAFEGARLQSQLDAGMREFVADPRNVAVDVEAGTVTLSKIFDWFAEDFGAKGGGRKKGEALVAYVNRYLPEDRRIPAGLRVEFAQYDKGLNAR